MVQGGTIRQGLAIAFGTIVMTIGLNALWSYSWIDPASYRYFKYELPLHEFGYRDDGKSTGAETFRPYATLLKFVIENDSRSRLPKLEIFDRTKLITKAIKCSSDLCSDPESLKIDDGLIPIGTLDPYSSHFVFLEYSGRMLSYDFDNIKILSDGSEIRGYLGIDGANDPYGLADFAINNYVLVSTLITVIIGIIVYLSCVFTIFYIRKLAVSKPSP